VSVIGPVIGPQFVAGSDSMADNKEEERQVAD
jgi:hypothetical protein